MKAACLPPVLFEKPGENKNKTKQRKRWKETGISRFQLLHTINYGSQKNQALWTDFAWIQESALTWV